MGSASPWLVQSWTLSTSPKETRPLSPALSQTLRGQRGRRERLGTRLMWTDPAWLTCGNSDLILIFGCKWSPPPPPSKGRLMKDLWQLCLLLCGKSLFLYEPSKCKREHVCGIRPGRVVYHSHSTSSRNNGRFVSKIRVWKRLLSSLIWN